MTPRHIFTREHNIQSWYRLYNESIVEFPYKSMYIYLRVYHEFMILRKREILYACRADHLRAFGNSGNLVKDNHGIS